jgi:hypothetical protein
MTTHHNTTYHFNGIEVVGGKLNLNDGCIDGVNKINIGEWSLEVSDDGDLCIKNDDIIKAKITNNSFIINNIKYDRFFMIQPVDINECIGLIVSSANKFYNYDLSQIPNIENTLPTIRLSTFKDSCILGVIINCENYKREVNIGVFKSIYEQDDEVNRVLVSTYGIGSVWVCDINGTFKNGDYITSSIISGYGMKQDDDICHNYTFGRIMQDCNFNPKKFILEKPIDFNLNGPIYEPILNNENQPITDIEYNVRYINIDGTKSSISEYEKELELLIKSGSKDRKSALKNKKRTIFKACLVCYYK